MKRYWSNDGKIYAEVEGKADNGKTIFRMHYQNFYTYETHEIKLYEWAKHLHGNAPPGTPYGYFRASRNGKRVVITV